MWKIPTIVEIISNALGAIFSFEISLWEIDIYETFINFDNVDGIVFPAIICPIRL